MTTELERLKAAHSAYKGVAIRERAAFRKEIAELEQQLEDNHQAYRHDIDATEAFDEDQMEVIEERNGMLYDLVESQRDVITLLKEKVNVQ